MVRRLADTTDHHDDFNSHIVYSILFHTFDSCDPHTVLGIIVSTQMTKTHQLHLNSFGQ